MVSLGTMNKDWQGPPLEVNLGNSVSGILGIHLMTSLMNPECEPWYYGITQVAQSSKKKLPWPIFGPNTWPEKGGGAGTVLEEGRWPHCVGHTRCVPIEASDFMWKTCGSQTYRTQSWGLVFWCEPHMAHSHTNSGGDEASDFTWTSDIEVLCILSFKFPELFIICLAAQKLWGKAHQPVWGELKQNLVSDLLPRLYTA